MATYTVTTTQDTDAGLTPAPADAAGSLRAAIDAANAAGGGAVAFSLPSGSTLALLDSLPDFTGAASIDFSGAPGLLLTSSTAGSTARPYGGLVADGTLTVAGALKGDAGTGVLLGISHTGSAVLAAGASLSGASTSISYPTVLDAGISFAVGANAKISATGANALTISQQDGAVANQVVTIAAGATISDTAAGAPTVYVAGSANGAVITNAGTLSATSNNTYNAASTSTVANTSLLVNAAGGMITDNSGNNAAVNLSGAASLQNAGVVLQTGNSNAVYNTGSGSVTNTSTLSAFGTTYYATGASTLTNSGTIFVGPKTGQAVYLQGTASLLNTGTISGTQGTSTSSVVLDNGTGTVTNSGKITGVGASIVTVTGSTLTNTGVISNTGATNAVTSYGGGAVVNSGSISNAKGASTAIVLLSAGGALTSTGSISGSDRGAFAVGATNATAGLVSINLAAGSTTTGAVGGVSNASFAITVAGALNGDIFAFAGSDTVRLVNGLSFTGAVDLEGRGDTLTLDGAVGSSTLDGGNVLSPLALVKAGAGTWTLTGSGANYTGVAFNGGVLELAAPNSAGAGAITFGAGVQTLQLDMPASGNFALPNTLAGFGTEDVIDVRGATVTGSSVSGDVLTLTTSTGGAATVTFAAGTLAGKPVAITNDGYGGSFVTAGAVTAPTPAAPTAVAPSAVAPGQTVSLSPSSAATPSTTPVTVSGNVTDNGAAQIGGAAAVTYTGSISGTGSLTVAGGSTVNLTGTSTYTGPTTVSSGTLLVNGSIASSPVEVGSGAVLGGSGATGAITADAGATVSPGNSPGVLTTTGDLTLTSGAALKEEIGGLSNTPGATTFDQINVAGKATLNGATLNAVLYNGFAAPTAGSGPLTIIHTTGGVSGAFAGLAEGATFTLGVQQVQISYVGGAAHTDVTLTFLAAPAAYVPPASTPVSQQLGLDTQVDNLIRLTPGLAAVASPSSPLYAQLQAEKAIAAQLDAGQIGAADAQTALFHVVDGTTSVAEISYAFFTGSTPTAAGLDYLVDSPANPNNLTSPYYAQFTTENRYINFAANLATGAGAGAAAFQAAYGALSLSDAVTKAYTAVFGAAPAAGKVDAILNTQVSNGLGGVETRAQYFSDITGGSAAAQKAAAIGFLLADSVKEGVGTYQQADLHFLQDLAHGTAVFNTDLLAAYTKAPTLVGQPVVEPTLGS